MEAKHITYNSSSPSGWSCDGEPVTGWACGALDCLDAGERPCSADLAVLRAEYPTATLTDSQGQYLGPIFPELF